MTVRNIKKSLAGVEDLAIGIGELQQERGVVHRVNVFPSSYSYIDMQQYEGGDFFRLYGSDVSYTDYRRNPAGTVGIPAGVGGVWEPLTNNDKIIGGNTIDGAYLVDETYLVWHAASGRNYSWSGTFPRTVAPGVDPTAVGSGYVPRTDVALRTEIGGADGARMIGACPDVATLRTIEPTTNGQRIPVIGYLSSHPLRGGSDWYADTTDTVSVDNGVDCIVTIGGKRWKRRNVAFLTLADCGLAGDNVVDDTAGFNRAISYSQAKDRVVYGIAGDNYKTTGALQLVNQTTNVAAKIHGAGRNVCTISPVGTFDAVRAWGLGWGSSGQGAAFEVQFGGFLISGAGLTGNLLDIRRVGLWSKFFDIRGTNNNGVGMYLQSVFDHEYRDIEMRNCAGLGVQVYESKASDPDGFQECSFLTFDRVHAINCNGKTIQWQCRGGDCYTFTQCKPSEGEVGIDFINGSVGHTLVGTYVDGQASHAFDNVGIRFGADCFGNSVLGGRYWNTKYAIDFAGGGRSSVSATNVVYDSPMGSSVFDVRLQAGVQQPVSVAAGLAVSDLSTNMLRVPRLPATSGTWVPSINFDSGLTGSFTYTAQAGEWWLDGKMLFVRAVIRWSGKPTAGNGAGITLPMNVKLGPNNLALRFKPDQMDVTGFAFLGHFQNNGLTSKLYMYDSAISSNAATASAFAASGSIILQASLPTP